MDCKVYNYVDDTQLQIRMTTSTASQANARSILRVISHWMNSNFFKLNPEKTELLVIGA